MWVGKECPSWHACRALIAETGANFCGKLIIGPHRIVTALLAKIPTVSEGVKNWVDFQLSVPNSVLTMAQRLLFPTECRMRMRGPFY